MSFYYPLGLLGLLGIPVLILIYIIKSKHTEQTIASTYLWELSERFLKRRKPVSKLTGILALVLEILAVIAASLLIAHPVFTVKGAANDYYFILDGSASMNMQRGGSTRFERAQDNICKIIDGSREGSSYSLVLAGDTTDVMFEGVRGKAQAKATVRALAAGWNATDCVSAIALAQEYFDANRSAEIYLLSDKPYTVNGNTSFIDVSDGESNFAVTSYGYGFTAAGVRGTGTVVSYSADATLKIELSAGMESVTELEKIAETTVTVKAGEPADFELQSEVLKFASLQIRIADADALGEDNAVMLYDEAKAQARKVLLINAAQDGAYLHGAISFAGGATVETVSAKKYEESLPQGYGMYVFNGYAPASVPRNAAVWLVNAADGTANGSGVKYRDERVPRDETGPESYFTAQYTSSTSLQAKTLTKDLTMSAVSVRKYAVCGVPRRFTPVMSVGGDTLVSAGINDNGDREVVFTFAIGDSDFGMSGDFLILIRNLMNYSFPEIIDGTAYTCGDTLNVNVVPGCENITVSTPSGKSITLDTVGKDMCGVQLNETGTYALTVKITGSDDTVLYAYACVPEEESRSEGGGALLLNGEKEHFRSDGYYDKLLAFFIAITILLLADWGIYCYEQYQLR